MEISLDSVLSINAVPDYGVKKMKSEPANICKLIAWLGTANVHE